MLQIGRQAADDSVPGALAGQFEIRIDGTPRTYRDRKDYAMEAARLLKSRIRTSGLRSRT
jgi:hypothetical protein